MNKSFDQRTVDQKLTVSENRIRNNTGLVILKLKAWCRLLKWNAWWSTKPSRPIINSHGFVFRIGIGTPNSYKNSMNFTAKLIYLSEDQQLATYLKLSQIWRTNVIDLVLFFNIYCCLHTDVYLQMIWQPSGQTHQYNGSVNNGEFHVNVRSQLKTRQTNSNGGKNALLFSLLIYSLLTSFSARIGLDLLAIWRAVLRFLGGIWCCFTYYRP